VSSSWGKPRIPDSTFGSRTTRPAVQRERPRQCAAPASGPSRDNNLHTNPYPNTASPGQPDECEAGNEDFVVGRPMIGNVPGNQGLVTSGQKGARE